MRVVERTVERPIDASSGEPRRGQFKETVQWLVRADAAWWEERDQILIETGIEQRRLVNLVVTIRESGPTDPVSVEALANFVESTPVMMQEMKSLTKRFGAYEARRMVMKAALQSVKDIIRFCSRCGLEPKICGCADGPLLGVPMELR